MITCGRKRVYKRMWNRCIFVLQFWAKQAVTPGSVVSLPSVRITQTVLTSSLNWFQPEKLESRYVDYNQLNLLSLIESIYSWFESSFPSYYTGPVEIISSDKCIEQSAKCTIY